jgi:hypothetical protein
MLLIAGLSCTKPPSNVPVCGLHSAAAPLLMRGESERMIAVGSKLAADAAESGASARTATWNRFIDMAVIERSPLQRADRTRPALRCA